MTQRSIQWVTNFSLCLEDIYYLVHWFIVLGIFITGRGKLHLEENDPILQTFYLSCPYSQPDQEPKNMEFVN